MKFKNLIISLVFISLGVVTLSLLAFGNCQWNKYFYMFQAYIYPTHIDGYINPPPDFTGTWNMWDKHGNKTVERQFLNGLRNGKETVWKDGNKLYIHHYKNDKFDGEWIYWNKDGQMSVTENWKNGKLNGIRAIYYDNGNKKNEEHYKDGNLNGKKTLWYESGKLMAEAYFKNGYRYGIWSTYNENGIKDNEFNWTERYEKSERVPEGL